MAFVLVFIGVCAATQFPDIAERVLGLLVLYLLARRRVGRSGPLG